MKLRGAISGFGEVAARGHWPGWLTRSDVSIVAIHEPLAARREVAMRMLKGVRIYDDFELMLDGEAPDFVDIASPPAFHADAIRASLEAGVHVLCEKPVCLDLAQFEALAKLAAANSRILMCVHNWKHAPAFEVARQVLDEGRLGALRSIRIDRLRTEPAGGAGKWRSEAASGGGILIDHGWHVFYLAQWLMGASPHSVSAHLSYQGGSGLDDVADLKVTFPGDRIAEIHLSWRASERRTSTILEGEKGELEIDGNRVTLTDRSGTVEDLSVQDAPDDSYHSTWFGKMAAEFETAIAVGSSGVNLEEVSTALQLLEASRKSSELNGASTLLRGR
ncbi:MAG TPA: Gfo/Idh/MocA family oxidoreductase [Candidatus Binataceae bacterium]|nr:Gfo/Idh/MocA family oxidoreductase [Candidatus Binataceae bacterium]